MPIMCKAPYPMQGHGDTRTYQKPRALPYFSVVVLGLC